jgi:hypothetical protein
MRGMRLGVATDSSGATRRHADAGIREKTPLAAWERSAAAQAALAFSRSPPGSPARAFLMGTKEYRVRALALSATRKEGKAR